MISLTPKDPLGTWANRSLNTVGTMGGGSPMVTAGSTGRWVFSANGTYTDARQRFTSATNTNRGDAYKGNTSFHVSGQNRDRATGRWRVDGPLLTLENNGTRTVHVAFILPHWGRDKKDKPDLMIDGDWWRRPEEDPARKRK